MMNKPLPPSMVRMGRLVTRWIELQKQVEEKQAAYRRDVEKTTTNYNALMHELEPFWTEQKGVFVDSPFEEMVWDQWVKPYVVDEGGTDFSRCYDIPYWVWEIWGGYV